jgi:hypothetical protein
LSGKLYGTITVATKALYSQYMMGDLSEVIGASLPLVDRRVFKTLAQKDYPRLVR